MRAVLPLAAMSAMGRKPTLAECLEGSKADIEVEAGERRLCGLKTRVVDKEQERSNASQDAVEYHVASKAFRVLVLA